HGGWSMPLFDPEAMGAVVGEVMDRTDALLFGRRTWDVMAAAWPERAGDPYADQMNSIRKYVVSRTLSPEEASSRWNNTALLGGDGDAIEAIRALRRSGGNDCLMLEPILLGGGKTIFPSDRRARPLELVSVKQAKTGVLICTYHPVRRSANA